MTNGQELTPPRLLVSVIALCAVLIAAAVAAGVVLTEYWQPAQAGGQAEIEVVKACITVITVSVLGAVVGLLTGALDAARKRRSELEEQWRESFTVLTDLLDRSTRCAHGFYVTCQHVHRQHKATRTASPIRGAARSLLDTEYLSFATEAAALETQIAARFGKHQPQGFDFDTDAKGEVTANQSWWRWHMVYDLLTIYYFALTGSFPGNSLTNNAMRIVAGRLEVHCGFRAINSAAGAATAAADDHPGSSPATGGDGAPPEAATAALDRAHCLVLSSEKAPYPEELTQVIRTVRARIPTAINQSASALHQERWRDLPGGRVA